MTKSTKKIISTVVYLTYAVLMILFITFGGDVSRWAIATVQGWVVNYDITDVEIGLDISKPLEAKETYSLNFTPVGRFYDDAGLKFESSNNDALFINNNGTITTFDKFDGAETEVQITVTSKYDKDFEKVINLTVKKVYPSDVACNYVVKGNGFNSKKILVGMTVYPYCYPDEGVKYSSNEYEILYDEEHFIYDENEEGYVAIKETEGNEKLSFTILYPDGRSYNTPEFSIKPYKEIDSFDEVRDRDELITEITTRRNVAILPVLYKDGAPVLTKVDITCSDPDAMYITSTGMYAFNKSGDFVLTFTLPNGFSKEVLVHARNKMSLPTMEDKDSAESHRIKIYKGEKTTINYTFPGNVTFKDVTYQYDENMINVEGFWHRFVVSPKSLGTSTLKIIIDDGFDRIEDEYTIEVVEDDRTAATIKKTIRATLPKIAGHMAMFGLLGMLAFLMCKCFDIKNKGLWLVLMLTCGLPWAAGSEALQLLIPGRSGTVKDVFIDMAGYLLGVVVAFVILVIMRKIKQKKSPEVETEVSEECNTELLN